MLCAKIRCNLHNTSVHNKSVHYKNVPRQCPQTRIQFPEVCRWDSQTRSLGARSHLWAPHPAHPLSAPATQRGTRKCSHHLCLSALHTPWGLRVERGTKRGVFMSCNRGVWLVVACEMLGYGLHTRAPYCQCSTILNAAARTFASSYSHVGCSSNAHGEEACILQQLTPCIASCAWDGDARTVCDCLAHMIACCWHM